jgi:hypothetical protein
MFKIKILQFRTPSPPIPLQKISSTTPAYYGLKVQDSNITQLTTNASSESSCQTHSSLAPSTTPIASYTAHLNAPFFGPGKPASAPIIEHVLITFPNSRMTPAFRARIEADFAAFDTIVKRGARGDISVAWGWVQESLESERATGTEEQEEQEEATGFVVVRGWESMRDFENVLKTEEYKEAIPLLLAWEAPFEMVSLPINIFG